MARTVSLLLATAGLIASAGCRGVPAGAGGLDFGPGLLVGPEAASKAPEPMELPVKDAVRACLWTAAEYEKTGQVADAIRLYEKARASDPVAARPAGRRLAVLYDKVGEFSKASMEYEALLAAAPADADVLNDFGYSLYCRGDWAGAEQALARAVEADGNHKRAWINLGLAQAQLGKWEEAYQSFCRVVRPADAHCNLAFVLGARGKTEDAKAHYRQALDLDPSLRVAQGGLAALEAPRPPKGGGPDRIDAAEAAAKVPTAVELQARLAREQLTTPFVIPGVDAKVEKNP
jgi:Tfp pilus assembly protein PilF